MTAYCVTSVDKIGILTTLGRQWIYYVYTKEWVSEWLNLTAFLQTADSEAHIVHISGVIVAYTMGSLSSLA